MLKRLATISALIAILALGVVVISAQTGTGVANACSVVEGQESVVSIGVPSDAVAGGQGVAGCRIIHDGSGYRLSPAVIGDLGVIRRGVLAAVDVFGISGGTSVTNFGTELQACLRGTGTMIFMANTNAGRLVSEMPAVTRTLDGSQFTCTFISGSGILVLVSGPTAPDASTTEITVTEAGIETVDTTTVTETDSTGATTVVTGATPLSGCRVTTTAQVRLREQASTDSGIITRLPFRFSLQATARTSDWVQVIYEDGQGWVSANFLNFSAGCSD
ncbi:MAG: SH3 domain-containing protein [Chloroflexota bacterium]